MHMWTIIFRSCVWLSNYRRVYTYIKIAVTAIFTFCLLRTKTDIENWRDFDFT